MPTHGVFPVLAHALLWWAAQENIMMMPHACDRIHLDTNLPLSVPCSSVAPVFIDWELSHQGLYLSHWHQAATEFLHYEPGVWVFVGVSLRPNNEVLHFSLQWYLHSTKAEKGEVPGIITKMRTQPPDPWKSSHCFIHCHMESVYINAAMNVFLVTVHLLFHVFSIVSHHEKNDRFAISWLLRTLFISISCDKNGQSISLFSTPKLAEAEVWTE